MWFDGWADLGRVVAVGAAAYGALVLLLRISGKRTLAKLNAFDLVVTVALGSALATILLSADVSWAEGVLGIAVLVTLQLLVAWTSVRLPWPRRLVTASATVLVRHGVVDEAAMRRERVTRGELSQALRASGVGGLDLVAAVVLETDGTLSVVTLEQRGDGSALEV